MFIGTLRPYQIDAVNRILRGPGRHILAFRMGLGKTPTVLAVTEDLRECGDVSRGLVVCTASLKYQWRSAISKFTDASSQVVDGTPAKRAEAYAAYHEHHYTILGYEQVRDDFQQIKSLPIDFVIADEATAIKSMKSKRHKRLARIRPPYRFALTATPVENRLEELYAIMRWVDPTLLGRPDLFDRTFVVRDRFGRPVRYVNLPLLHELMEPYWTVLTREDVVDQLPEREDYRILVPLDPASAELYDHITEDLLDAIEEAQNVLGPTFNVWSHYTGGDERAAQARGMLMSRFGALRMLCDHPELLRISARKFRERTGNNADGSEYASQLDDQGLLDRRYGHRKLDVLLDRLDTAKSSGEKVVVFTGFAEMAHLISAACGARKIKAIIFEGKLTARQRKEAIEAFQTDPSLTAFVSTDAGGYGVDLPQASLVINYDLHWSSGAMEQRGGRIDRVVSEHERIEVVDLLVEGSIEEWMAEKLDTKKAAAGAVLKGDGMIDGKVSATGESLRAHLSSSRVARS